MRSYRSGYEIHFQCTNMQQQLFDNISVEPKKLSISNNPKSSRSRMKKIKKIFSTITRKHWKNI